MKKEKTTKKHPFEIHKLSCERCSTVDTEHPATLINCCLDGAPILRDFLVFISSFEYKKKQKALKRQFLQDTDGKVHKSTKKKVQEVMMYKDLL